jgi:hypothetical protein
VWYVCSLRLTKALRSSGFQAGLSRPKHWLGPADRLPTRPDPNGHSVEHHRLLDEAHTRAQEPIELSAGFEFIEPSQCGDDALPHLIARSAAPRSAGRCAPMTACGGNTCTTRTVRTDCAYVVVQSTRDITITWHYQYCQVLFSASEFQSLTPHPKDATVEDGPQVAGGTFRMGSDVHYPEERPGTVSRWTHSEWIGTP